MEIYTAKAFRVILFHFTLFFILEQGLMSLRLAYKAKDDLELLTFLPLLLKS